MQVGAPRVDRVGADVGLSAVIQDERLVGVSVDEGDRGGELAGVDEYVVGQPERRQCGDAAVEVVAVGVVVGFALEHVAYAAQARMIGGHAGEDIADSGGCQRRPADDAANPGIRHREFQQPLGFRQSLSRLDGDGSGDVEQGAQVGAFQDCANAVG